MDGKVFLRQVLDQAEFGVVISDLDSNLLYLNATARRLLGVGSEVDPRELTATQFRSKSAGQLVWDTLVPEVVKVYRKR